MTFFIFYFLSTISLIAILWKCKYSLKKLNVQIIGEMLLLSIVLGDYKALTGKLKYVSGNGSLARRKCHHSLSRGRNPWRIIAVRNTMRL